MPERTTHHDFQAQTPGQKNKKSDKDAEEERISSSLTELYAGVAIEKSKDDGYDLGIAIHDGTYSIDFALHHIANLDKSACDEVGSFVIERLSQYREEHSCKFLGVGVSQELGKTCPKLAPSMWEELDIVPFVLDPVIDVDDEMRDRLLSDHGLTVDEQADVLARKCLLFFSPTKQPRTAIGYKNNVLVDGNGRIRLTTLEAYKSSVREPTWRATMKYVEEIKERKLRIVFFNATPQGGGVALMRHALLRFLHLLGVHVEWYVPRPKPDVFRITKTNHNILQGTVDASVKQSPEQLKKIHTWIQDNAKSYWTIDGGPLSARSKGGADLVIVDDPQMPDLIPIAKENDKDRPVIFRSHIEVRDDLVGEEGSAAQAVWQFMWSSIKLADVFISHPVKEFVPSEVNPENVGYMPATTDWLDGLNKTMKDVDVDYYLHEFNTQAVNQGQSALAYPKRPYVCQIARFDPAKGIPHVIKSFAGFRKKLADEKSEEKPQLVICGHSSVDDPDGTMVFDQTTEMIEKDYSDLKKDIIIARLGPSDQVLNAVMSKAKIVMQLSTREGFEVKVSEAIHKGKPTITTRAGGIPLQIADNKNGYLVATGDAEACASHLYDLYTDSSLYSKMSDYALHNVSDEVHTVGNALCWMYMATRLCAEGQKEGQRWQPKGRWVNDLAREEAGEEYKEGEPRLPRDLTT